MRRLLFSLFPIFLLFLLNPFEAFAYDNITIVIDPGHGGSGDDVHATYGAVYSDDLLEKNVDLITAQAMYDELTQYPNLTVYMTRQDDVQLSLKDRVDFAESVDADLMVCVHYNASAEHIFYGSEIFTSAFGSCYTTGYGAALCIMDRWRDYGLDDRGIKTRLNSDNEDYYGVIRHGKAVNLPVIIIEHGYLDNHIDIEKIGNEDRWRELGWIDADGIANYYGIEKNVMSGSVSPAVEVGLPDDIVYPDDTAPSNISVEISQRQDSPSEEDEVLFDYTISCDEDESRLMYYSAAMGTIDTVEPTDFADLKLWGDRDSVSDTLSVPYNYSAGIVFRVYNIYGLYTDYETYVEAIIETEKEIEEAKKTEEERTEEAPAEAEKSGEEAVLEEKAGEDPDKRENVSESKEGTEPTASEIEVENKEGGAKDAPKSISSLIEGTGMDSSMVYVLVLVLATIVFILLIIIIALVKQGLSEGKDEDEDFYNR